MTSPAIINPFYANVCTVFKYINSAIYKGRHSSLNGQKIPILTQTAKRQQWGGAARKKM